MEEPLITLRAFLEVAVAGPPREGVNKVDSSITDLTLVPVRTRPLLWDRVWMEADTVGSRGSLRDAVRVGIDCIQTLSTHVFDPCM